MTKSDIFSLALKILGIYTLIIAISSLRMTFYMIFAYFNNHQSAPSMASIIVGSLLPLLLLLLLSYYLIDRSDKLGKLVFPNSQSEKVVVSISTAEVQAIAFSIIGVLVIVWAIPKLFQVVIQISFLKLHLKDVFSPGMSQKLIEYSIDVLSRLALGIYLFFGSKGLVKIWHRIHALGNKE